MEKVDEFMIKLKRLNELTFDMTPDELQTLWIRCESAVSTGRSDMELYKAVATAAKMEWIIRKLT